jgi:argininosuccinate lyase
MQLTKEILFPALEQTEACLQMLIFALPQVEVKPGILNDEKYKYLFSVEAVNDLVNKGTSFRDAYKQVGNEIEKGQFDFKDFATSRHQLHGSMGNLQNEAIKREIQLVLAKFA